MTELAELVAELREEARCLAGEGIGDDLAEKFTKAAAAIERLERERADWEAACDGNTALGAEIAETLKAALEAAESRALTAEAELEKVREALTVARKALTMLTEPEAIVSTSTQQAWAQAVEAGVVVRRALSEERK